METQTTPVDATETQTTQVDATVESVDESVKLNKTSEVVDITVEPVKNIEGIVIISDKKEKNNEPINNSFTARRKIVADYSSSESDSDDNSTDSEISESSSGSEESSSDIEEIVRPVEEIKISVPPEECQEVGKVKFVVDSQVIVEPKAGLAALDLNTILFLDEGKRALGRVEDVFGPVTEPLYIVMFPNSSDIVQKGITVGMQVYYAPATDHTSYVFLPVLMKLKGSDASWKHNKEVPPEMLDFSDDEEEAKARGNYKGPSNYNKQSRNGSRGYHRGFRTRPHRGSPRLPRNFSQSYPRGSNYLSPIRPPVLNVPPYPPSSIPPFNPNFPPPFNSTMPPPRMHYNVPSPFSGIPPPPGTSEMHSPGTSTSYPMMQDMRNWQRQGP